jgi:lipoyl(octanoyl) transferase
VPIDALWLGKVILIRSAPQDAVTNMAIDDAMLRAAAERGTKFVRLYQWDRPSVSFGRNERCAGLYSAQRCEAAGVPAVRRPTGGRALLHARELTYSVAAPNTPGHTLRSDYDAINRMLLAALQSLGVAAELSRPATRTALPDGSPCFDSPSAGEIVVLGQKLVGSAQHRNAHAFLQHGSLLLDDDQGLLGTIAASPLPPLPPPATLRALIGQTDVTVVMASIEQALRAACVDGIVEAADTSLPAHHVAEAASRYRDARWTWRR